MPCRFPPSPPARLAATVILITALLGGIPPLPAQTGPGGTLPAAERDAALAEMARQLESTYVIADLAGRMNAFLSDALRDGVYAPLDAGEAFAARVTSDLQALCHDGHLRVRFHADPAQVLPAWNHPSPEDEARHRRAAVRENHGFVRVEILSGNIGYLRLDSFGDPASGGDTAAAAMRFVAGTDALIIDLRENGGGYSGMVALLASYLLGPLPAHLSDFHIRSKNEITQTWTLPYVPGPTYAGKPVCVLTGPSTYSAAESFAYDLQSVKRVRVVGQTTGGGAHPGRFIRVSEHLAIFIPDGRPVNVVTGTNWERTGVKPDVEAETTQALTQAHRLVLDQLLHLPHSHPDEADEQRKARDVLR